MGHQERVLNPYSNMYAEEPPKTISHHTSCCACVFLEGVSEHSMCTQSPTQSHKGNTKCLSNDKSDILVHRSSEKLVSPNVTLSESKK